MIVERTMKKIGLIFIITITICFFAGFLWSRRNEKPTDYSVSKNITSYPSKKAFVDAFSSENIQIGEELSISEEEKKDLKYRYLEFGQNRIPTLLVYYPGAPHFLGEYEVYIYRNQQVQLIYGNDEFFRVYPEAGVIEAAHYGGGYGTLDTFYTCLNDDLDMETFASSYIMSSGEMQDLYVENFGKPVEDAYCLGNIEEEYRVSKSDFEKAVKEKTRDSSVIDKIDWTDIEQISVILD